MDRNFGITTAELVNLNFAESTTSPTGMIKLAMLEVALLSVAFSILQPTNSYPGYGTASIFTVSPPGNSSCGSYTFSPPTFTYPPMLSVVSATVNV